MKLTAETVTKDNVIEYLERKDIDIIGVDEHKEEIVFDDFTGNMFMHCTSLTTTPVLPATTFAKNYENLINENRNKNKDNKKENTLINVIFSSNVLPFIIIAIIWLLLLCLHLLFDTDPNMFIVLFVMGPFIYGILEMIID